MLLSYHELLSVSSVVLVSQFLSVCLVQCRNRTSNGGVHYKFGILLIIPILMVCLEFAC